ncbi:hypothetical protein CSUB01_07832 [Colletotrichum sublineola]|uniref:Uncharacterized protein n=1 Tax=Colletotrichum sublineola TaxID=1173701 RepID=A0A066XUU3_COLSU|nr:hypothetical protein CSUB01_07832 [Colletotrichum sublineola]
MANTVLSAYTLSLFNTWTILLLIVWTFNPLGSQSSLRSLYLQDRSTFQTGLLSYIGESLSLGPSEAPTPENVYIGALSNAAIGTQYCNGTCDGFEDLIGRLGGRTAAAAQISTDPWGSPKIPRLRYVPGFDSSQPQNWLSVPWKERVLEYSSFIGKRIHGLDPGFIGNVTFTIVTSYIEVTNRHRSVRSVVSSHSAWFSENYKSFTNYNPELDKPPHSEAVKRIYNFYEVGMDDYAPLPLVLDFNATLNKVFVGMDPYCCFTSCMYERVYVDSEIFCEYLGGSAQSRCGVNRIRQTPYPPPQDPDYLYGVLGVGTKYLLPRFLRVGIERDSGPGSSSARFIRNPLNALNSKSEMSSTTTMCDISMDLFENRLSLLLNTFADSASKPFDIIGAESGASEAPDRRLLNVSSRIDIPLSAAYDLNTFWVTIYFLSTAVMLLAAFSSFFMHWYTSSPQVLGFVGSLIRDSPYFSHVNHAGSSTESGEEISKRLGHLKVGVFDVQADDDLGKIAFAPAEMGSKVQKGRWYQ